MRRIAWVTAAAVIAYGSAGCSGSESMTSAATPTLSPAAGTYNAPQAVTLSCVTADATIYYTIDGSAPTTSSTVYAGPITVSATTTLKAIAVASGFTESGIASATYTINLPTQTATPTFAPAPGPCSSQQSVTLSCETAGAIIHYTLDGSAPTTSSTVYASPITVSATTTIKAIAVANGFTESGVASGVYVIGCASNNDFRGCHVGDACHWGYENAYCGWLGGPCLACPPQCYCLWGFCWYRDTGDPCPAPYSESQEDVPLPCTGCVGTDGVCQPGSTAQLCGTGGAVCATCGPDQTCTAGACVPALSCTGCVQDGVCYPGDSQIRCGTGGEPCTACAWRGANCLTGTCEPNVTSCRWDNKYFPGCYVGNACYPGYENARCGEHGGPCLACPAECYCYGLCWYKDTGDPCPAPYAK